MLDLAACSGLPAEPDLDLSLFFLSPRRWESPRRLRLSPSADCSRWPSELFLSESEPESVSVSRSISTEALKTGCYSLSGLGGEAFSDRDCDCDCDRILAAEEARAAFRRAVRRASPRSTSAAADRA